MLHALLLSAAVAAADPAAAPASPAPRTLRLEIVHSGNAGEERFAEKGIAREGAWPGNPARPIDDTNLGKYLFEVVDRATDFLDHPRALVAEQDRVVEPQPEVLRVEVRVADAARR